MNSFWNEKYAGTDYLYGKEPNAFIKQELKKLKPGKILFPAEGEGRNAIYATTHGWDVVAFDPSTVAQQKALKLADLNQVTINYQIIGYNEAQFTNDSFDVIALSFAHMPPDLRVKMHKKYYLWLKSGGTLVLEGFSKKQLQYNSGGPKDISMLFSKKELTNDFKQFSQIEVTEKTFHLNEGTGHSGNGSLIQLWAKK
ncbi:MAG: class I SAM-dependent methyltransferase [Salinivirgaceae bacterium]|jgi:hypothetical protein|nr:class I SAM-dependent methyltransferase [Salinivirgaceae bacterium]